MSIARTRWEVSLRRIGAAALVGAALLLGVLGSTGRAQASRPPGTWCGGRLWQLMTLSDHDRGRVQLAARETSIAAIARLSPPARITGGRSTGFQRQVWELRTVVDRYRIASNGELVLVLYSIDSAQYMNAFMPNPACLSAATRGRAGILAARAAFGACPAPTPGWQLLGATVDLAGVGFWDSVHTTRGALANGAELRPVTSLKLVAGCGVD